jgi:hypothetical protein
MAAAHKAAAAAAGCCLLLLLAAAQVQGHGMMYRPAPRNWLAYLEGNEWCPHCQNGGSRWPCCCLAGSELRSCAPCAPCAPCARAAAARPGPLSGPCSPRPQPSGPSATTRGSRGPPAATRSAASPTTTRTATCAPAPSRVGGWVVGPAGRGLLRPPAALRPVQAKQGCRAKQRWCRGPAPPWQRLGAAWARCTHARRRSAPDGRPLPPFPPSRSHVQAGRRHHRRHDLYHQSLRQGGRGAGSCRAPAWARCPRAAPAGMRVQHLAMLSTQTTLRWGKLLKVAAAS